AGANDGLYRRLCAAVDRADLAADERYRTNSSRVAHREELVGELERVFAAQPADEWVERLGRAGVPAGRVRGVLDALAHARTLTVEHPTIGALPLVASPLGPRGETSPPPLLGQHTQEVLAELGYDDGQIEALLLPSSA
ncbi:MAG TPA: CoA transferase, partial [Gaiellaceae bacterium]|nr:CoA transferase [Gaiellaceae bacterium]